MLRRDYIVQAIEECMQALLRIRRLRQEGRWEAAQEAADAEFEKLVSTGAQAAAQLSETELLARLAKDQPTYVVRNRMFVMISLLQEAGEIALGQGRASDAPVIFLKALNLLLQVSTEEELGEHPAYVPRAEALVLLLDETALPVSTLVLLMRHYESTGQYGKAEDILFSLLDATRNDPAILALGTAFYSRILRENDETLAAAQLPRGEAREGFQELERRKNT
ncbi:MAG TPA: DUF6483 family protein [Verrucomicrobiae bacterium]|jgi:hypothetical protein